MREFDPTNHLVVDAIKRHVERFPDARDTPRGVQEWWLPAQLRDCPIQEVTRTLWRMVADGQLVATTLANSTVLFARNPDAPPRTDR